MTQIAQAQVHDPVLRSHRVLLLATLGALVAAAAVLTLAITSGSRPTATSVPRTHPSSTYAIEAGPAAGTPSAVAQALGSERVRGGISLTTNLPAVPTVDGGPSRGTVSAVSQALSRLVPTTPRVDAGPATGTPAAVADALSGQ
jgi:hypothetical protein